jgi:hypothetical protein
MRLSRKLQLPKHPTRMKQSFKDNGVPKLELGNEAQRRRALNAAGGARDPRAVCGDPPQTPGWTMF